MSFFLEEDVLGNLREKPSEKRKKVGDVGS